MTGRTFPELGVAAIAATRDALHAYARVIGGWAAGSRRKRKHWWQASLRPSLNGLTTGVIYGPPDFELELNYAGTSVDVRTDGQVGVLTLDEGQSSTELARRILEQLESHGVNPANAPGEKVMSDAAHPHYSADVAWDLHQANSAVTAALEDFRAGIREETSPIQVWPHHFDLSMIWLPGPKIPGQDPMDEEYSDKQMNFGFVFGDEAIDEPYFYVTAYPLPDALPKLALPAGTTWRSDGFSGAVLLYRDLIASSDPGGYLLDLWNQLLAAGREHLGTDD